MSKSVETSPKTREKITNSPVRKLDGESDESRVDGAREFSLIVGAENGHSEVDRCRGPLTAFAYGGIVGGMSPTDALLSSDEERLGIGKERR